MYDDQFFPYVFECAECGREQQVTKTDALTYAPPRDAGHAVAAATFVVREVYQWRETARGDEDFLCPTCTPEL